MNKIYILIYLLLVTSNLFSQVNVLDHIMRTSKKMNTEEHKNISRAKSHEHAGLYEEAHLIYKQVFKNNPGNQYIFSSYKSFLKKQSEWDLLVEISIIYSNTIAPDPFGKLTLADSYLLSGRDDNAYDIFRSLFENYSNDLEKLKRFISKLVYHHKIDFALQNINQIRNMLDYPDFYARELGTYYYSKMEYSKSLNEYLLYLNYNVNQISNVRGKLMGFPQDDEIRNNIRKILKNNNSKLCNVILAEYEFKWKNYESAYNLMINNYLNEDEIYEFAIDMITASQFPYAEKIFNKLTQSNNNEIVESSIYQLANILELKTKNKTMSLPISDNIIETTFFNLESFDSGKIEIESNDFLHTVIMYDSLISRYNNSEARYKLSNLKYKTNRNVDEAIYQFNNIEKESKDRQIAFNSAIKIINLNIESGRVDFELIKKIEKYKKKYTKRDQIVLLDLKKNQALFYLQEFEQTSENLKEILKKLSKESPFYNDFIDGFATLMLFNGKDDELSKFSSAIYHIKQNNFSDAIPVLLELNKSTEDIIANLSIYYLSYIYIKSNNYSLAEETMLRASGDDIYLQLVKLLAAEMDDYMNKNINSAIDKYLDFLDNHESSIYYEDIRLRLKDIIG